MSVFSTSGMHYCTALLAYIWVWLAQMLFQVDSAGLDVSGRYYSI